MKVRVAVIKTDGINCDHETMHAFSLVGARPELVHMHALRTQQKKLTEYDIVALPGGFSYGDDLGSGNVFALEILSSLRDQLQEFIDQKKLMIGICNGFQVLVRLGLLPIGTISKQSIKLDENKSGKFECRWTRVQIPENLSVFTKALEGQSFDLPVAHAQGNVRLKPAVLDTLKEQKLIAMRYAQVEYPYNPNGSIDNIAGICDTTGRILGLMPHPERFVTKEQHPLWRSKDYQPLGLAIFEQAVSYCR